MVCKKSPILVVRRQGRRGGAFLCSIFKNSKVVSVTRNEGPGPEGTVMSLHSSIDGQKFLALNGGPQFTFSPAVSFLVNARRRKKWTTSGISSPKAAKNSNAAGSG